jgi:hypothetical protein
MTPRPAILEPTSVAFKGVVRTNRRVVHPALGARSRRSTLGEGKTIAFLAELPVGLGVGNSRVVCVESVVTALVTDVGTARRTACEAIKAEEVALGAPTPHVLAPAGCVWVPVHANSVGPTPVLHVATACGAWSWTRASSKGHAFALPAPAPAGLTGGVGRH